MKILSIWQNIIVFFAGVLLTLAFAPFQFFLGAIISTTVLLTAWLYYPKKSFFLGWLFGVGFFGTGVYWIFISVNTFGNVPVPIAAFITGLLIAILALFPAITGYLLNRFFTNNTLTKLVCAFPALWVLLEWIRTWIFSGFPWLMIGYTQINSSLRGYAPIFSIYGVSLAVLITSGLLVTIFFNPRQRKLSLTLLIALWLTGAYLASVHWTQRIGDPIKVSLVQGNIAQELKWSPDHMQASLDTYQSLTEPHWDSKIIVWPESAIPFAFQQATDYINGLGYDAVKHNATVITGIPIKAGEGDSYYNAVVALGNGVGFYTKRRLVPFGEFIPMKQWVGKLFDILNVPMSDFIAPPNHDAKPLLASGFNIATFICYEIAFPEQVRSKDKTVNALLTVSNDAWFGKSIAQAQHLEMAQMRALEMGRPVLFVSNDGLTAIINPQGYIQSKIPPHQAGVLTDTVQMTEGKTPWQYIGMDPILGLCLLFLYTARKRQHENEDSLATNPLVDWLAKKLI